MKPGQAPPNINTNPAKSHLKEFMENLGSLAILLAFCVALVRHRRHRVVGRLKHKPFLIVSGERAVYARLGADHRSPPASWSTR